jgi:hypothetical protein
MAVPILYRAYLGHWNRPVDAAWFVACGYALQVTVAFTMAQWTVSRLRRDLYTNRLDELLMTRCTPADIAMGEALASAVASMWLVGITGPVCVFLACIGGFGIGSALLLILSLAPAAALGVWFGMGWGLTFTLRRSVAIAAMTDWWVKTPFAPFWLMWSVLGCLPIVWAFLELIHGGHQILVSAIGLLQWMVRHAFWNWNPLLPISGIVGWHGSGWLTNWLVLVLITLFMMRKSMDAIQASLATLPERDVAHHNTDYWIHHEIHYFEQYGGRGRREPEYRDQGNPIAAFDVALGHRVFLHPFLWALTIMLYLFLLAWSLLFPALGRITGMCCTLIPATGALLLMSGGVAVSFGWERDQHRWSALAVLPISDFRLALGKIKGVVRPTLWLGLLASATALAMGLRGTLHGNVALWMALHVLVFPVTLACVSATLALTTANLGDALFRWAVLGAIPTLAFVLPPPIGGLGGISVPFTPPFLVFLLVLNGPVPELLRGAWISLGLEIFGIGASLLILDLYLRRWTVGERD